MTSNADIKNGMMKRENVHQRVNFFLVTHVTENNFSEKKMDKWKELLHRALLECQKIEHRQNNTKMLRIDDVISKINDFLKYRNDNGEFNEICEPNSNGTKISTNLTKEVIAALFRENVYICVEGKSLHF